MEHVDAIKAIRSLADYASEIGKFHRAAQYNDAHPIEHHNVGDWVLVFDPSKTRQISARYSSPYDGPFEVIEADTHKGGPAHGKSNGYYKVQLILGGRSNEPLRYCFEKDSIKKVQHARTIKIDKRDGSPAAYHLAQTHTGADLVDYVESGPLRDSANIMYLIVRYVGFEFSHTVPLSTFLTKNEEGKDSVTTNPIIIEYLAKVGLAPNGKPLPATSGR